MFYLVPLLRSVVSNHCSKDHKYSLKKLNLKLKVTSFKARMYVCMYVYIQVIYSLFSLAHS